MAGSILSGLSGAPVKYSIANESPMSGEMGTDQSHCPVAIVKDGNPMNSLEHARQDSLELYSALHMRNTGRCSGPKLTLTLDWPRFGRRATWQCNRQVVECADRVALFWDQRNREALSLLKFAQKLPLTD